MTHLVNSEIDCISLIIEHLSDISRCLGLIGYDFRINYQTGTGERR